MADLQDQLAGVIASIVKTTGPVLCSKDRIFFRMFWVLNHLLAAAPEDSISYETVSSQLIIAETLCCWLIPILR